MTVGHVDSPGVLVVGAGTSIVEAVAEGYLRHGHHIAVALADGSHAGETHTLISRVKGGDGSESAATALVARARQALGRLDIVVRVRPAMVRGALLDQEGSEWAEAVGATLAGAYHLSRAAARAMTEGGAIVHVLGPDATHAYPQRSADSAAQSGIIGLIRALSIELAPRDVRVNAVIAGPLVDDLPGDLEASRRDRLTSRAPSARLGHATEVANAVRFVSDARSSFMTGQTLRVDGGWASLNQAPDGMRFP